MGRRGFFLPYRQDFIIWTLSRHTPCIAEPMFQKLLLLICLVSLFLLGLSFTGRFLALGESLAVFRLPVLIAALPLLFTIRKSRLLYLGLALIGTSLLSVTLPFIPQKIETDNVYQLYQKNLSFRISDITPLKTDILNTGSIDFITLQEVTDKNAGLMAELKSEFPSQHVCPFAGVGGTAVLSRWKAVENSQRCFDRDGMTAIHLETPAGPVWLISIHLNWPFPYGQAAQVQKLLGHMEGLEGPKVIGGDFNMVPWSYTMRAFERASGSHMAGAIRSFDLPYIPMSVPIDHVLVPKKATVQRRSKKGSDHYGLLAEFNLP